VGIFERIISKSGFGFGAVEGVDVVVVKGDAGVTRSSRHSLDLIGNVRGGVGWEVDVVIVDEGLGEGAVDWNMCIGRASKNSWAMMKGVALSSAVVR
jgi:hypothetical protein